MSDHATKHPEFELRQLFNDAEREFLRLDSPQGMDDKNRQAKLRETITKFLQCGRLIRVTGVFSPNEDLDDINSEDLRYLLTPAIIADLTIEIVESDARLHNLKAATEYTRAFLTRCQELKLLNQEDEDLLAGLKAKDAVEARQLKINRFKREKQCKEVLKKYTESIAKSYSTTEDIENAEVNRDQALALLNVWINRSCLHIEQLKREIEMLEKCQELRDANDGELPEPPKSKTNFKPFTLTRDMVKVFGQHHTPYTYTPEQMACREHDLGLHNSAKSSENVPDEEKYANEMDNEAANQADIVATYKARKWDAYTDEHKRGEGNRYNRS